MEYWKRAVLAGAAGAAVVMFVKGNKSAGLVLAGVGLATLASEYPEKFAELREDLPEYFDRGTKYFDIVTRVGERIAKVAENRGTDWYESLLSR